MVKLFKKLSVTWKITCGGWLLNTTLLDCSGVFSTCCGVILHTVTGEGMLSILERCVYVGGRVLEEGAWVLRWASFKSQLGWTRHFACNSHPWGVSEHCRRTWVRSALSVTYAGPATFSYLASEDRLTRRVQRTPPYCAVVPQPHTMQNPFTSTQGPS